MQKVIKLLLLISINLIAGCSHLAGNVVPNTGPTMENIYDDLGEQSSDHRLPVPNLTKTTGPDVLPARVTGSNFSLLENPELKIYFFPHLAGSEMLPIPGYWTEISAYPRNYFALPLMEKSK